MSTASTVEREMLALINQERTSRGLDPLQLETRLNDSSEDHSTWMLGTDRFSHTGQGGSSATQRMQAAGFDLSGSWRTGENIAWQSERGAPGVSDDVAQLHQNLMNSPGHRANILNPDFKYIGIGVEAGDMQGFDAVMVTQNFAATQGEVILDNGGTTPPVTPPVDEVAEPEEEVTDPTEPEVPDTDVTETEEPVDETPYTDVNETEEPADETPDTDVTETEEPADETPDTDVTETEEPADETPDTDVTETEEPADETPEVVVDTGEPGADCFDVQAFLAGIEAFVNALQAHFDQFEWAPVERADSAPEMDDFDLVFDNDAADDMVDTAENIVEDVSDNFCNAFVFEMNCAFDFG
ncbi:Cysteine-rich secretory protein family protein [Ruegeria halocynthiae]|uniref:Cysteine-rich secretory protein family protein n=1 Tax=Ruegeria halocynthiae TaxID=985054 RepID=A0A1H2ZHS6_9RHOB|nr:CAP domain-containing protein [Ruegeria halocynthiae]SDX16314.1 Cysteine-rich secretory protein family protein [Ruegeria halocynthiae]